MTPSFMIPPVCSEQGGDLACNHLASALEVAEFVDDPPRRLFAYISEPAEVATTWMGDLLGTVRFGKRWRGPSGDERVSVTLRAINGSVYRGVYYRGAGDYARFHYRAQR